MESLDKIKIVLGEINNPRNWERVSSTHIQSSLIPFRNRIAKLLEGVIKDEEIEDEEIITPTEIMDKPTRAGTLEDTMMNFPKIIALGHQEKVIENFVLDMYRRIIDPKVDLPIKMFAIFFLEKVNKVIEEKPHYGKPEGSNISKG